MIEAIKGSFRANLALKKVSTKIVSFPERLLDSRL